MIQSHSNSKIKLVKSLLKKKYRDSNNMFIVEGERFVNDIPSNIKIEMILISESFSKKKGFAIYKNYEIVDDKIFKEITDTANSQGILAVCHKMKYDENINIDDNSFILIGDRLQDPGNVGTLIRTAVAAGATHIILSKGSVDIYNSKVIRSTASTIFNIPILENVDLTTFLPNIKNKNVEVIGTHLKASENYFDSDMKKSIAIIIGNEANGMSYEVAKLCDKLVKIPMLREVESLNASVSSAILMYEVVKQRLN